jgi:pimeloyl-ACP methyl ester carboxylesterase
MFRTLFPIRLFVAGVAFAAATVAAAPDIARGQARGATASLAACGPERQAPAGAQCGVVNVPENRTTPGGRQIALSVVVLPSRSPAGRTDPVFGIAAAPGSAASLLATTYPRLYDMLQADHDIVLVDQRGTGRSGPLVCVAQDVRQAPAKVFDLPPDAAALTACRDRLSKDADLAQYTLAAAALDLDAVRQALGYSKINILAISHGTRVALEYLRRFGPQVRAVALSGVAPPSQAWELSTPQTSQQALRRVFDQCWAQADCQRAFPALASDFTAVLVALDREPAAVKLPIGDGVPPLDLSISRSVFTRELAQFLLYRDDIFGVPLVIHRAASGDFVPFAGLALQRNLLRPPVADGTQLSVACAQDLPSFTPPAVTAAAQGTFLRDDRARFLARACAIWPRGTGRMASTPVTSAVPALLISGALDPIAPPRSADLVAKTLANSVHMVIENASHVPANPCVNNAVTAFFKTATATAVDTSCRTNLQPIKFVTSWK